MTLSGRQLASESMETTIPGIVRLGARIGRRVLRLMCRLSLSLDSIYVHQFGGWQGYGSPFKASSQQQSHGISA
jgi:hypothetical protein